MSTVSISTPTGHVEPASVLTNPSRYSPFQKNWGPISRAGPATTDIMSTVSIPAPTVESGASAKSSKEAKQRAFLESRLKQNQRRKNKFDTQAKQRALLGARLEHDQLRKDMSATKTYDVPHNSEGDQVFTLGDQFSNGESGLNQPDTAHAQASTESGIDMDGDETAAETSLLVSNPDIRRPLETIPSQVSQTTSSSSIS